MIPRNSDDEDEDDDTVNADLEDRKRDYSELKYIQAQLADVWEAVEKGFEDKQEQDGIIEDGWDMYHCVLNGNQTYTGTSQVYVPIVADAMTARETRFINTLFPQNGRYCDITGNDGTVPYDLMAVIDYYVKQAELRETVAPAMIRSGDISGQYGLYLSWEETTRCVTSKVKKAEVETPVGTPLKGAAEYDDREYEEIKEGKPDVQVLDGRDFVILPTSIDKVENADIVAVHLRNFTKKKIKTYIKRGIFEKKAGEMLIGAMGSGDNQRANTPKADAKYAGIKTDSKGNKQAVVTQVWTKLKIRGEMRLMVTHFAGSKIILGCKRNPYWCDRIPVLTKALEKNPNSIWGKSQTDKVAKMQYEANDFVNMAGDSGRYGMLPIVMTDPEKNPRSGSMVLAMASVWLTDPNSTQFAQFPPLWKEGLAQVAWYKDQIFQSLGVNPAMVPHGNAGKKPSQAQIAQEQQVALESSADNVALIQEGLFSKVLEWFYEFDYQYRTEAITVKKFGQLGLQADMDQVEPWQTRERFEFKWYGTEGFKAAQQVQQQISWVGTIVKIPPQMLNGRKLDIAPLLEVINGTICGPRVAPHVLIDQRHQLTIDPETENDLIANMFPVQVHDMDNDQEHIMKHLARFREELQLHPHHDKVSELARGHILQHIQAMKTKAMAAMGGQPGGGGGGRAGAQIQGPSGPQQPAGAVRPDAMPLSMPRKGG